MQPQCGSAAAAMAVVGEEEAYVDIRVCDIVIQQSNMPTGLDGGFHIDGLYVVLRCRDDVRRTDCLWPSATGGAAVAGDAETEEDDLVWNELFRFAVPPAPPPAASAAATPAMPSTPHGGSSGTATASPFTSTLPLSSSGAFGGSSVLPMSLAAAGGLLPGGGGGSAFTLPHAGGPSSTATSTPPLRGAAAAAAPPHSPLLYPAIELELWRSTPFSENLLGQCTYHVLMELAQAGADLGTLDAVVERVVQLRTKEAPSIMGNLYGWSGHRLSLRLRVQATGLAPLPPAWAPPYGGAPAMMSMAAGAVPTTSSGGVYPPHFAAAVAAGQPAYGAAGAYGAPMGTLNPVLASLLAPLGVTAAHGNAAGHMGTWAMPMPLYGGGAGEPSPPPFLPMFAAGSPYGVPAANGGGGSFYPPPPPPSTELGILGDGDAPWQSTAAPPIGYPPYAPQPYPQRR